MVAVFFSIPLSVLASFIPLQLEGSSIKREVNLVVRVHVIVKATDLDIATRKDNVGIIQRPDRRSGTRNYRDGIRSHGRLRPTR